MSIGPPIPGIQLFQILTLKIQGHGHGWGQSWKSQHGANIQSTHISFLTSQLGIPFPSYNFFKIWPWKSRSGSGVRPQCRSSILLTHISFVPCNSPLPIPEIHYFKNLTLKIQGQGQMTMILHNYRSRRFHRTSNGINPSKGFRDMCSAKSPKCFLIWQVFGQWASPYGANGQIPMVLHNYRSRQVHKTLNGVNLSSSFRDTHSTKSKLNHLWRSFWPMGKPIWGKWVKFHRFSNGENLSSGYRDMGSTSLAAARLATRPPAQTVITIPLQPGGLRG